MEHRRTAAELEALDAAIEQVLAADHPQSVRHVFYRMTDPRLEAAVPKTEAGYRLVQRRCLALRRSGEVPYGWISGATRRGYHVATYGGPGEFIRRMAGYYRAELWTEDEPHVEVWCESRSLAGVLQGTCEDLAVSLYPAGGFSSATLAWEAARQIDARDRDFAVVLYVGDYDPAGLLIDVAIERELRRHIRTELDVERLAVTEEQIEEWGLPTKPRKAGERRLPDVKDTVEAEAVPAARMRALVRAAVEAWLPDGALERARAAEASEREGLKALGVEMEGDFMGHAP